MKPFTTLATIVLALIAILQLMRFVQGWEVTINGMIVPVWVSGIAFVVAAGIAAMLWRESRTPRRN
jgi:membrane protein implicated in regulation of membrane protease activity